MVEIWCKAVVVSDAPAWFSAATTSPVAPAKTKILSLGDGATTVADGGDLISNIETVNGKDRIETTIRIDYTFGLGMKG